MLDTKHNVFLHSRQVLSCSPGPSVFISAAGEIDMFFSGNRVSTKKYFVLPCLNLWENVWTLGRKLVGINNICHTIFLFIIRAYMQYSCIPAWHPGGSQKISSDDLLFPGNSYCVKIYHVITRKSQCCINDNFTWQKKERQHMKG